MHTFRSHVIGFFQELQPVKKVAYFVKESCVSAARNKGENTDEKNLNHIDTGFDRLFYRMCSPSAATRLLKKNMGPLALQCKGDHKDTGKAGVRTTLDMHLREPGF